MRGLTRRSRLTAVGALAAMGWVAWTLLSASAAGAVTLNGDWAPFNRCPVDNPAMLAADGVKVEAFCAAADSPSGSATIGNTTVPTGDTNLQFGVVQNNTTTPSTLTAVAPAGGALKAAPAKVPGGLLGLMCPSNVLVVTLICNGITNSQLNAVTATVQSAGPPSNFNLTASFRQGQPIVTLPVKIHLKNPILGSSCFIGSNSDPIVLHPRNLTAPTFGNGGRFDANGTPDPTNGVLETIVLNSTEGDNTFVVPGASGCDGLLSPVVDAAIDLKLGLPSPSGKNSVVLNNTTTQAATFGLPSAFAPHEGQALASDWHSAVLP